jgi:hypothetical protein
MSGTAFGPFRSTRSNGAFLYQFKADPDLYKAAFDFTIGGG